MNFNYYLSSFIILYYLYWCLYFIKLNGQRSYSEKYTFLLNNERVRFTNASQLFSSIILAIGEKLRKLVFASS